MRRASTGSTVPRRQLGRHLRALREKARMKSTEVAKEMDWSQTTVSRLETGHTAVRPIDIKRLLEMYGADERTTAGLMALARETKAPEWWRDYRDAIPEWLNLFLGLEQAASRFRWYESHLIPGVLQTARYAETVITHEEPLEEVADRVRARLDRQTILTRGQDPPQYEVILDEDILHRPVVGPDLMAEQLERLVEISELANVTLRVLPYSVGYYEALTAGPFVIMDFPQRDDVVVSEPTTVYVEELAGALYLDKPSEVARYTTVFDELRERSLDEQTSRDHIIGTVKDLK